MGRIRFETTYTMGEYYTPLDILRIANEKLRSKERFVFIAFFGFRLVLFLIAFVMSIIIYPIFLINKLFYLLNDFDPYLDAVFLEVILSIVLHIFKMIVNIFYFVTYFVYKILNFVLSIILMLYQSIPPKTAS